MKERQRGSVARERNREIEGDRNADRETEDLIGEGEPEKEREGKEKGKRGSE